MIGTKERVWRFLTTLKSDRVPRSLIFLDTETLTALAENRRSKKACVFSLGCICSLRWEGGKPTRLRWEDARTTDEFWEKFTSLIRGRETNWVFAHNLGFDLTVLKFWERVENGDFTWQVREYKDGDQEGDQEEEFVDKRGYIVISDPPTILKGWWQGKPVVMVDWLNYMRQPLAVLGESIGLPKLPIPQVCDPHSKWLEYCYRDVDILRRSVCRTIGLWESEKCGPWAPTAAGLASNYFRRRSLKEREIEIHNNEMALGYERWSYYGGQVLNGWIGEVIDDNGPDGQVSEFQHGGMYLRCGRVYVCDVNSLYPHVMASDLMPARLSTYQRSSEFTDVLFKHRDLVGIAYVRINSEWADYPVRVDPVTFEPLLRGDQEPDKVDVPRGTRTLYARGRFWTVLAGAELTQAMRAGHVDEVRGGFLYYGTTCFRKAVNELWQRKQAADKAGNKMDRKFWKLVLNSIYGKFGQKGDKWIDRPDIAPKCLWGQWASLNYDTKESMLLRSIGGWTQQLVRETDSPNSCPAIAACITAGGRARMRELRSIAGLSQVYYQDTDSLHLTRKGYDELLEADEIAQDEIGKLKLEKVARSAFYFGQKQYKLDGNWTMPGITGKAIWKGGMTWQQDEFARLATIIASTPPIAVPITERRLSFGKLELTGEYKIPGFVLPYRIDSI